MAGAAQDSIDTTSALSDPSETFNKLQDLLKSKNDTSRFVGLALLKTVLDNGQLAQDPDRVHQIWESLSPRFLDRLLRAKENEKTTRSDAKDLVDLAVAIIHTFANLLPAKDIKEKRLTSRLSPLIKALVQSTGDTTDLILKTLVTTVSQPEGAIEFMSVEDLSPLTEIATQYPLVLDCFTYSWISASSIDDEVPKVRASIDNTIPALLVVFKQTDGVTLIQSLGSFLPKLEPSALNVNPAWLIPLVSTLRKLVSRKPTATGRAAYTHLAAALLQAYPAQCPVLLFKNDASETADSRPFGYLFINLLLIDLRSSFPSLLSQLNSTSYTSTSQRLAAAFDILSSFIGFLVRSLDDKVPIYTFSMPPDLLLKLRKDVGETISLTIEYLRDRWDASIAGASGLHPSARTGTSATSEGTRLTLTWESMEDNVTADPLVLAGIRALAIWIREDGNENLRNEASGLMDMFVDLYKASKGNSLDFRYPILLALEPIMLSDMGVEGFLGQCGWEAVSHDLQSVFEDLSARNALGEATTSEASKGLEIVRVLLAVLDHESTHFPREEWMPSITLVASMKVLKIADPLIIELQIAALQFASALLSKAASGVARRHLTSIPALLGLVNQLRPVAKSLEKTIARELADQLDDVTLELDSLRPVR